jgi:type VI secretion system protein ImpC
VVGEPLRVDRDNLNQVLARLGVGLSLTLPDQEGPPVSLGFQAVEDFHPDHLLESIEFLRPLREAHRRLNSPATFRETALELGLISATEAPTAAPMEETTPASTNLLEQVLKRTVAEGSGPSPADTAWQDYLKRIVRPHVHRPDPRQAEVVAGIEMVLAMLLRDLLHHSDFQTLEATWRGVYLLTQRLDTDGPLTIELIDTTRGELENDLISTTALESTATYRRLVDETVGTEGGRPWGLLVGDFRFEPTDHDVALLWRLGQIARLAGAPFVSSAGTRFVGCDQAADLSDPDRWESPPVLEGWWALRSGDEAPYLGLALPRFLLRGAYGAQTNPVDTFPFEELSESPSDEEYLWGNPAFAVALLVGRAASQSGWSEFDPELGDLPVPLERRDGEVVARPCTEAVLTDRAVDLLLDAGLMPLAAVRDTDFLRLVQLRSVADPPSPLAISGP